MNSLACYAIALTLSGAALAPVAAFAEPVQATVNVADLDLSRPADVARFDVRVAIAARTICASTVRPALLDASTDSCRRAVADEAVKKLGDNQRRSLALGRAAEQATRVASR